VTGGAGLIGSHVAEALIRRGTKLSIVDDLESFYAPSRKQLNLQKILKAGTYQSFEVDVRDMCELRKLAKQVQPEIMIHLTARAGFRPSIEQSCFVRKYECCGDSDHSGNRPGV
jgi:UDP-glucuronate 4-epimerase